jgi:peptidoglycan/xylan/chitin deacetylase (PgdA/CDA1 family)
VNEPSIPILTYHGIGAPTSSITISPERFEKQLAALARSNYRSVSLSAVLDWQRFGTALPEKAFVITFDDGYESVLSEALPRLKSWGFDATVFLITAYLGKTNRWPTQPSYVANHALLTWDQLDLLVAEGWELGAHTRTHPLLPVISPEAAEHEILSSKQDLEAHTGTEVKAFAFPYGASSSEVEAIVRRNFAGAVGADLGVAGPDDNRFLLPRIDAHYLRPELIPTMGNPIFRPYLKLRQSMRTIRRRVRPDWEIALSPYG